MVRQYSVLKDMPCFLPVLPLSISFSLNCTATATVGSLSALTALTPGPRHAQCI